MAATINEDGLHVQPWFIDSFMILKEDVADAAADGKRVAVILSNVHVLIAKKCITSIWQIQGYLSLLKTTSQLFK